MALISGTTLAIEPTPTSTAGRCRARVRYTITIAGSDPLAGRVLTEHITIGAVDRHDAPVGPRLGPVVEISRRYTATAGTAERAWDGEIARIDLDVEKDWWAPSLDGRPIPIAELTDHLAAHVSVRCGDDLVGEATSPVVSGSWGVLGRS